MGEGTPIATAVKAFVALACLLQVAAASDEATLISFKSSCNDPSNRLNSWSDSTSHCKWSGVSCSSWNSSAAASLSVSRLVLEGFELQCPASSLSLLSSLTQLRVLSLKNNFFSGLLPGQAFSNLTGLKLIFLSHNNFSGPFPLPLLSLPRLSRLDLSFNSFSGELPVDGINSLSRLLTLRLESNNFSGSISRINISSLQVFNVSSNQLAGQIPTSLSGFPRSAFSLNPSLCGYPLQYHCEKDETTPTIASSASAANISTSPTLSPEVMNNISPRNGHYRRRIGSLSVMAIVLGDILILALVSLLLYCYFSKNSGRRSKLMESTEKIVYGTQSIVGGRYHHHEEERGRMVFFQGAKRFELEDLLRASAEMLGKGGYGTAYKAVLSCGSVVAVKRLKDGGGQGSGPGRKEFEHHIEVLGKLRHPNVVSLTAYYIAKDEKLLVYEYMPNGTLFWILHGNRGPGRTPLDWTSRLKIAAGAAKGIAYIHGFGNGLKLSHGGIKSTNILLDKFGNARVADFGLPLLASPAGNSKPDGYRAPELQSSDGRKSTQKSDVYSFGVLLLEILTGKCPSWSQESGSGAGGCIDLPRWVQSVVREEWTAEVFDLELMRYKDIEEEMVTLLQLATACTATAPNQRPKMRHVVRMIDEIKGAEFSPCDDHVDSDSPCVSSEDNCGDSSQ